ncbi:MAG: type II toxin-antitoxin system VapC family toxin [Nitrososphaerales archaeon]
MSETKPILTLDSNIFVAAAKGDEPHRKKCLDLLKKVPDSFFLAEPSIVYEEVCGTVARRVGSQEAQRFAEQLDRFIPEGLLYDCDKRFCLSSYSLCSEHGVYAIDALYLSVAINARSVLVSLDREDFIEKVKKNRYNIEVYHVSEFPY